MTFWWCYITLYVEPKQQCIDESIENCPSLFRLKRIMDNYIYYYCDIDCIDIQLVLDDFLHLLDSHNTHYEFEYIADSLGFCDIKQCYIFIRHYRQRRQGGHGTTPRSNKSHQISYDEMYKALSYDNLDNVKSAEDEDLDEDLEDNTHQIASMQILDTIHCYFCHTFDIGFKTRIRSTEDRYTKRLSEPFDLDQNEMVTKGHKLYNEMMDEIGGITQKFTNGITMTDTGKHDDNEECKNGSSMYSFGVSFEYDISHNYKSHKHARKNVIRCVRKRYDTFKQEITSLSDKVNISVDQWKHQYKKAELHYNSYYCKAFITKYNKTYNEVINGPIRFELKIEHLLALMFYCNYDKLQYEFSKTYRRLSAKESNIDIAERHRHFYHLGMWIKRAVHEFGTRTDTIDSNDTFYHGISQQTIFSSASTAIFNGPLSTSTDYSVAACFANQQGLILELRDIKTVNLSSKYFAMHWLSCYSNEQECLFIACDGPLLFKNIICIGNDTEYKTIIRVLYLFEYIFNDKRLFYHFQQQQKKTSNEKYEPLEDDDLLLLSQHLLHHQLNKMGLSEFQEFESLDDYASNLVNKFCLNQKDLWINVDRINNPHIKEDNTKTKWIKQLFGDERFGKWINMNLIHVLFPNIESLNIRWRITVNICILDEVLKHLQEKETRKKLKLIRIAINKNQDNYNHNIGINTLINEFKKDFEKIGFTLYLRGNSDLYIERISWYHLKQSKFERRRNI